MKILLNILIFIVILIQSTLFAQEATLSLLNDKYSSILKEQNKGVAILVKKNNEISTSSIGNFSLNENSVFNIGSATKTFTSILVLQEVEKGTIKLSDTIGKFLKPVKNIDSSITLKQLLTHETGLDEIIGKNILDIFFSKADSLYTQNLFKLVEKRNIEKIGSFDYCNTNYFLLGRILEKITDESYFDLLRKRIIEPLGLKNTHPYLHKNLPKLAAPYHDGEDVSKYLDYKFFANIAYSAGSMASTLSDMEIFYSSLFQTEKLLKKETIQLMIEDGNDTYGLGVFKKDYKGKKYVNHGGNNIGYAFRNAYDIETGNLFLIFSNTMRMPSGKAITNDLYAYLHDEKIQAFEAVNLSDFKDTTGKYLLKEANLVLEIKEENKKLYLIVEAQGAKSELAQKSEDTLYDTTVGASLTKITGSQNSLTFKQNGFTTTITRIDSENSTSLTSKK
ncbi:serine hydrolase domain-containing protein [Tenacibaculum xiamenense]|uniref:serine hydrolase domain-containing protein n=1 Tax=Tenacibaculum xiamenense TaxID=1261553 RepID=UPI003893E66E